MRRERIMNELTVTQQEQTVNEEQKIAKVVAEQHAKQAHQQREEEEKRATMLKTIATHRELTVTQVAAAPDVLQSTELVKSLLGGFYAVSYIQVERLKVESIAGIYGICYTNCVSPETRKGAEGQNSKAKCPRCTEGQERG